jgi:hypothetical protein
MNELEKLFNQEVDRVLSHVKSKSKTYGEAEDLITEFSWERNSPIRTLVISEVKRKLISETKDIPLRK